MNVREEDAQLTSSERLVYAAAFALDCSHLPCNTERAYLAAWVAVMVLRDDKAALHASPDWERVRDMYASFKRGGE